MILFIIETHTFDSNNLIAFVDDLDAAFDIQSPGIVSDTGSTITYNVSLLPSGGKHTTSRQREDIGFKKMLSEL